jgi:hypothetical protein
MNRVDEWKDFESYRWAKYEPWMDWDEFVESYQPIKHDAEAMRRLADHILMEIERRCDMGKKTRNAFLQATPEQVKYTLYCLFRGWV